jgi:hypothetical protein
VALLRPTVRCPVDALARTIEDVTHSDLRTLPDDEKACMRRWVENWRHVGPMLDDERRQRLAALTDEGAWLESQGLLQSWEPTMTGDAGEGLRLQQAVFVRWQCRRIR